MTSTFSRVLIALVVASLLLPVAWFGQSVAGVAPREAMGTRGSPGAAQPTHEIDLVDAEARPLASDISGLPITITQEGDPPTVEPSRAATYAEIEADYSAWRMAQPMPRAADSFNLQTETVIDITISAGGNSATWYPGVDPIPVLRVEHGQNLTIMVRLSEAIPQLDVNNTVVGYSIQPIFLSDPPPKGDHDFDQKPDQQILLSWDAFDPATTAPSPFFGYIPCITPAESLNPQKYQEWQRNLTAPVGSFIDDFGPNSSKYPKSQGLYRLDAFFNQTTITSYFGGVVQEGILLSTNTTALIEIYHHSEFKNLALDKNPIVVGETVKLSGALMDADQPIDIGIEGVNVNVFLDGKIIGNASTSDSGAFQFSYQIPADQYAGKHVFELRFFEVSNQYGEGYYLGTTAKIEDVVIRRITHIEMQGAICYRNTIYDANQGAVSINGSLADNRNESLNPYVESFNDKIDYLVDIEWDTQGSLTYKQYRDVPVERGRFEKVHYVDDNQQLGPVRVRVVFEGTTYYLGCEYTVTYTVKAHTHIVYEMPTEEGGREVSRGQRIFIQGYLQDDKDVGLGGQVLQLYWGEKELPASQPITTLDHMETIGGEDRSIGYFRYEYKVPEKEVLGPVTITIQYRGITNLYDPCTHEETLYVISITEIVLLPPEGDYILKGHPVEIKGYLRDDQGVGIPDKSVDVFWMPKEQRPLEFIGNDTTGESGLFSVTYLIPASQPVGIAFVSVTFAGSSFPYAVGDAYKPSSRLSDAKDEGDVVYNISTETRIANLEIAYAGDDACNPTDYAKKQGYNATEDFIVRNDLFTISGILREYYGTEILGSPVPEGKRLHLYLIDSGGEEALISDKIETDEHGAFEFTGMVPFTMDRGDGVLRLSFIGAENFLPSETKVPVHIMVKTRLNFISVPDTIMQNEWFNVTVELKEDNNATSIPNAKIYLVIKRGDNIYTQNMTTTDNRTGRAVISQRVRPVYSNCVLTFVVTYGKMFDEGALEEQMIRCTLPSESQHNVSYKVPTKKDQSTLENVQEFVATYLFLIIPLLILIVLGAGGFYWWWRVQRLRGMQKIIRKAADELVAGNEYVATIFKAYRKLIRHLQRYGYLRRESETFREFERAIRAALPIDAAHLDQFLTLLEEARYSSHEIGTEQRDRAIESLRAIEASLAKIQSSPEALNRLAALEQEYTESHIVIRGVTEDRHARSHTNPPPTGSGPAPPPGLQTQQGKPPGMP